MTWIISDIRAPPATSSQCSGVSSEGTWAHATAEHLYLVNATPHAIQVANLPQHVTAIGLADRSSVSCTIDIGASGAADGASTGTPWAWRLEACLEVCENEAGPCVAVIDPPPTNEIASALAAMNNLTGRIGALRATDKLIILTGPEPGNVEEGTGLTYPRDAYHNGMHRIHYCAGIWNEMRSYGQWGAVVTLPAQEASPLRMRDSFALLLGTRFAHTGPYISSAVFPEGCTLPESMFAYMSFSDNVLPGSARASRTRGITAATADGKEWTATVVLSCEGVGEETDQMRHLRTMMTSDSVEAVGGSYFALHTEADKLPSFLRRSLSDTYSKIVAKHPMPAPGMCRVASHHRQSPWS